MPNDGTGGDALHTTLFTVSDDDYWCIGLNSKAGCGSSPSNCVSCFPSQELLSALNSSVINRGPARVDDPPKSLIDRAS